MLNMTSLYVNLNCEPHFAVFLALKLHSQTRSKTLVELLHKYDLGVSHKKVLTIEVNFAQIIANQTRINTDIVCLTNFHHHIFTIATWITWITIPHHALQTHPSTKLGFQFFGFLHHRSMGWTWNVYETTHRKQEQTLVEPSSSKRWAVSGNKSIRRGETTRTGKDHDST